MTTLIEVCFSLKNQLMYIFQLLILGWIPKQSVVQDTNRTSIRPINAWTKLCMKQENEITYYILLPNGLSVLRASASER